MKGRRIAATVFVAALAMGGLGLAVPAALACTGPNCSSTGNTGVSVSATVGEYITLTGLSPTINFGQLVAGQPSTVNAAETYTIGTNDPSGYSVTLTPGGSALTNGGSGTIPNSALSIVETEGVAVPGEVIHLSGASVITLDSEGVMADTYQENWTLQAPSPLPAAGSYGESFTYTALAA